ncbi:chemotaxis protein CheW [Alishewanella sp. 16-MA]|uniref:Chemotaxis protein CheW n=1 Tax=Alishewanella maricola TaxID=2795740 RepID=A0ABS8C617_9ALTE|nr:chemotaxis protein CheW [Alishewanella maricola]MCB5227789.1 chemotaxis protein CheW [Alishewanella maricola]
MSQLIASQKVIQGYLDSLLTEDDDRAEVAVSAVAEKQRAELNTLLAQAVTAKPVAAPAAAVIVKTPVEPVLAPAKLAVQHTEVASNRAIPIAQRLAANTVAAASDTTAKAYRKERFQVLFFNVAGLKIAVPLTELGGIHELRTITSLFGKPNWFRGVMLYREQKINVVDTARWVMPEKYNETLEQELNYNYLIMLGSSNWGLCCESLIDTMTLEPEEVKWREHQGKRPWIAGLIKEHMCVLLEVDELIALLNQGLDINARRNRARGAVDE